MPDDARLPAIPQTPRSLEDIGGSALPPSLQILLDEGLYTRMKQLAGLMSKAEGFTPRHLIGKPEACFAIINTSLDWKLNPHFVARHTYQTPGGSIGFDGALVQSVLERSGRFVGSPEFDHRGDWEKLTGKFEKKTSGKGNEYVVGIWTDEDAVGLGIIVRWLVRGENKPRVWPGETTPFWLTQCYPRNSPLWATDPKTQIAYLAIRRFANQAAPGILGAASFDYDDLVMAGDLARDVTPQRPRPEDYATDATQASTEQADASASFEVVDFDGQITEYATAEAASAALLTMIQKARTLKALEGRWEDNIEVIAEIAVSFEKAGRESALSGAYAEARKAFEQDPGQQQSRSVAASTAEFDSADAGSSPAATSIPADHGQTEHLEERQSSTQTEEQKEAVQPHNIPGVAAPPGEPKHSPESETLQNLAAAETDQHLTYWTRKALAECRETVETDDLWRKHEKRYLRTGMAAQKEIRDMFKQRNRELSA